MEKKKIDPDQTIYKLLKEYPELKTTLVEAGLTKLAMPMMAETAGRRVTLRDALTHMRLDFAEMERKLDRAGYQFTSANTSVNQLKKLLERLNAGEDMGKVRQDFLHTYKDVSPETIIAAEQQLLKEGMPHEQVQQLCDLHSVLFHGHMEAEHVQDAGANLPAGHPVCLLKRENEALGEVLNVIEKDLSGDCAVLFTSLVKLKAIRQLYSIKEETIMPLLERRGYDGPATVMWGVDDELKKEASRLASSIEQQVTPKDMEDIRKLTTRIREMIYKEENILFPLALEHIHEQEWMDVDRDMREIGPVFTDSYPLWEEAAARSLQQKQEVKVDDQLLKTPFGEMSLPQLTAFFTVLPMDVTLIDAQDTNRFFTNFGKIFVRPKLALGHSVYDCHPLAIRPIVKKLIADFKSGARDKMEMWVPKRPILISYCALRGQNGEYLGTLELVQDMEKARQHFEK